MADGIEPGSVEKGTEHLQVAAREMLSAARAFLDAIEDIVEDPDRIRELGQAVGSVAQQAVRVGKSAIGGEAGQAWYDGGEGQDDAEGTAGSDPLF